MAGIVIPSPDITNLDYSVLFDISGAAPSITITNLSTIVNPTNLTWWFVITSPSGVILHAGSLTSPDKTAAMGWLNGQVWVMPDVWLSPFLYPTIEFSCSVPYTVNVFVQDSTATTYNYPKGQTICKPNGNNVAGYNFGLASTNIVVQCATNDIYATDVTNYTYQGLLGTSASNTWTMTFPADATGTVPPNTVITNQPYVFITIGYIGYGYTLNYSTYALYTFPNECSIKIQYKSNTPFGVWCGIDLCGLVCNMKRFYNELNVRCGQVVNDDDLIAMGKVSYLMTMALASIVQPACGNDIHWMVKQIKELIGDQDCGCTQAAIGVNGSSPTGSACCPPATSTATVGGTCAVPAVNLNTSHNPFPPFFYTVSGLWTSVAGITYEVWLVLHGTPVSSLPVSGVSVPVTVGATVFTFPTLLAPSITVTTGNTYDFYIKSICSSSSTSAWTFAGSIAV